MILGNLDQHFFLTCASRTACTVCTKEAVQQYTAPYVHRTKTNT